MLTRRVRGWQPVNMEASPENWLEQYRALENLSNAITVHLTSTLPILVCFFVAEQVCPCRPRPDSAAWRGRWDGGCTSCTQEAHTAHHQAGRAWVRSEGR